MFTAEINLLIASAASIAFIHTLMGPDHYLPFVSMGLARRWTLRKMLVITAGCGLGHIMGSIALGFVGVALQWQLSSLQWLETIRGDLAAWALTAFGLMYCAWGLRRAYRKKPHNHWHHHGEKSHCHQHNHLQDHSHIHDQHYDLKPHNKAFQTSPSTVTANKIGPWAIFIFFVLGPCEPLIPLLMYPAAKESSFGLLVVTIVFGLVTMLTMLLAVTVAALGMQRVGETIGVVDVEKFGHAMTGATLFACGSSIIFLGF